MAIFKREKEIARRLEFDGLYVAEQPEDDDIKSHWDKMVISAKYVTFYKSIHELYVHNYLGVYNKYVHMYVLNLFTIYF